MTAETQTWAVALIVAAAALYLLWRWLPARWRAPLARLHPQLAKTSGCGGCNGCSTAVNKASACPSQPSQKP